MAEISWKQLVEATLHPFTGVRGLQGYTRFTDTYDTEVELQASSAVEVVGHGAAVSINPPDQPSYCWLRLVDHDDGEKLAVSAHLGVTEAAELSRALLEFISHASGGASG
jgi:hypothetical protein